MSSHVDLGAPCPFLVRGEDGVGESTPMLEDTSENAGRMPLYMQWGCVCMVLERWMASLQGGCRSQIQEVEPRGGWRKAQHQAQEKQGPVLLTHLRQT